MINRVLLYTDGYMESEDMHRVESRLKEHWDLGSPHWQSSASVIRQTAIADR